MSLIVDESDRRRIHRREMVLAGARLRASRTHSSCAKALLAPDLLLAEVGNAVWKRVRKQEVTVEDAVDILSRAGSAFSELVPLLELAPAAMELSATLDHPIYDCFYVALAARERAPLVTADARLLALAKRAGVQVETSS